MQASNSTMNQPINRCREVMVISESVRAYCDDYIWQKGYTKSTADNYTWASNSFIKACGDIELSQMTMEHVITWRKYMESNTYETSAINCNLYKLRCLLRYYQSRIKLQINPNDIIIPKKKKTIPKHLTVGQVSQLLHNADTRGKAIIALLFASGIRVGELCQLRKKDIIGDCIKVRGKGNIERLAFIDDQALKYLNDYLKTLDGSSQYLFPSDKGGGIGVSTVQKMFKDVSNELDFDCSAHVLRHTFATMLAQNGCGAFHLQKLLGHAHISTTQIYIHLSGQDIKDAYTQYHSSTSLLT